MKGRQSCLTFYHRFSIHITIFLVCLLILSSTQLRSQAEGGSRLADSKPVGLAETLHVEEAKLRAQIGSRPPSCERRCRSCGHCEAVQVPTNPQFRKRIKGSSSAILKVDFYGRGTDGTDGGSNYKPMSWKCKCGNLIFNP